LDLRARHSIRARSFLGGGGAGGWVLSASASARRASTAWTEAATMRRCPPEVRQACSVPFSTQSWIVRCDTPSRAAASAVVHTSAASWFGSAALCGWRSFMVAWQIS
jgi:hypothetical protein